MSLLIFIRENNVQAFLFIVYRFLLKFCIQSERIPEAALLEFDQEPFACNWRTFR